MPFNKLHSHLQEKLEQLEIITPTPFQSKAIPIIKSGANVYCAASNESGKTTTLILTTLQKLKCEEKGNAPRAVVLVENKEKALALYELFLWYTKYTSVRVYVGYEQLHIDIQKSEIAMGTDILITTPQNMNKLFLLNGVSVSDLKIVSMDDAEILGVNSVHAAMLSITQSILKCQYVLYTEKMSAKLDRYKDYFMERSKTVVIK